MSVDVLSRRRVRPSPLLAKIIEMQDGLLQHATGGHFEGGDERYQELRAELMRAPELSARMPDFVRANRDLFQFWEYIKHGIAGCAPRRRFLWDAFDPLISAIEADQLAPATPTITGRLEALNADAVEAAWKKALDRRVDDPEGAITAARTLLESVCKHLLDDIGQTYDDKADLPKLYAQCASALNLAPDQHTERSFKAILGNCQSVVNELASLRNRISDAHGRGRRPARPSPRHAEFAVNLAGTVAAFLVATWSDKAASSQSLST
jgi:Abortive infection C-terminus